MVDMLRAWAHFGTVVLNPSRQHRAELVLRADKRQGYRGGWGAPRLAGRTCRRMRIWPTRTRSDRTGTPPSCPYCTCLGPCRPLQLPLQPYAHFTVFEPHSLLAIAIAIAYTVARFWPSKTPCPAFSPAHRPPRPAAPFRNKSPSRPSSPCSHGQINPDIAYRMENLQMMHALKSKD